MIKARIIEGDYGVRRAVFDIPLDDATPAFMSVQRSPNLEFDEQRCVVIVDSVKFLALWKADPVSIRPDIAHGNPQSWRRDRKFADAEDGFREGIRNPVPLALVSCEYYAAREITRRKLFFFTETVDMPSFRYVTFTNGITRTIWLLSHGCKAFPVECGLSSAGYLHDLAGLSGTDIMTVAELLPVID